ncbi:MAG: carbon starvation protein A [Deltaproteobacteria bacterium]|nr:carbon starvation protein A [Deltaproteobacteria bacterium]
MSALWVITGSILFFILGYKFWGNYVSGVFGIDSSRKTPAETINDGVDYVPTRPSVLIGHHFSSIAGAAPIIGPITAAIYGWGAVLVWILFGGLFMGAVHDFSSLVISVRHGGKSLGAVIEKNMGKSSKLIFLLFVYATLILVVSVFTNAVAITFVKVPQTGTASMLFIGIAMVFGFSVYRLNLNFIAATIGGIVLLFGSMYIGFIFPVHLSFNTWRVILLVYVFAASVLPVWVLLQPRDYLNSYILYIMLLMLVVGILWVNPQLKTSAKPVMNTSSGPMIPLLFVTVACGALSGFHSLVSSGTTSKQLASELHAKPVGFGSMLIESVLATGALITAAMLTQKEYASSFSTGAITLFSNQSAIMLSELGLPVKWGRTFMSLAVAAFALTSLDTATRLGRFAVQEFFQRPANQKPNIIADNRYIATLITVLSGALLVFSGSSKEIWPIFGAANQLLAALSFLAITVWLVHMRKPSGFAAIPGVFIYLITMAALVWNIYSFFQTGKFILAGLAFILIILALFLGIDGIRVIKGKRKHV